MAVWITGDTHGLFERFSNYIFPEQEEMTKDDVVIICGDFGGVWDFRGETKHEKYWLDWLQSKPFTLAFVDGNHENHERLAEYPVKEWHGGKVREIRPSVLHLMRGEVFEIEGKKFFTFGGAASHDISDGILDYEKDYDLIKKWRDDRTKMFRVEHHDWWKEELPSQAEMQNGIDNITNHNFKIDYIITHCASASTTALIGQGLYKQDILTKYLEEVRQRVQYSKWFMGHYHVNLAVNAQEIILYELIIRII